MKILSFGFEDYKPFREQATFEVRPLTLIFGKNSSGKSASLRSLRLILRALTTRQLGFPLDVEELQYGNNFSDLVHNRLPHGAVSFHAALEDEKERFDVRASIQNFVAPSSNPNLLVEDSIVSKFQLNSPIPINLNWQPSHNKVVTYDGVGSVPFRGMLPDKQGDLSLEQWKFIADWKDKLQSFEEVVEHLGPLRSSIARVYGTRTFQPLGFTGTGAPNRLAKNSVLLEKVANWYQENLDGWRLSIEPSGIAFQCSLVRGKAQINLADAGQGMQQVLPIVVQQLAQQTEDTGSFLHLVEQPELHLHTAAQAPLGDLFLDSAKLQRGQIIVETHSENMLLRIRRRIAEGADPNLVALYWIEDHADGYSQVRRINIDESGNLDWWRDGVFSEGYEEVRAMKRALNNKSEEVIT
jgi:hypothetical protein